MANNPKTVDKLDEATLSSMYGYALNVIYGVPEMTTLFKKAVAEQWTEDQFTAKLMGSEWWKNNDKYARAYITAKAAGGADWETMRETARNKVKQEAARIGRTLTPEEENSYADMYMSEGWGDPDRASLMDDALAKGITVPPKEATAGLGDVYTGVSGDLVTTMKAAAYGNGLTYTDDYYNSAAKSVAAGLSTADDWVRDIQKDAASKYPWWADKILAGSNARTAGSAYITTFAQTYEMNPNDVSIDDPIFKQAFGQTNDKGDVTPMNLFEFQKLLRSKPQFEKTKQYQDEMASAVMGVAQTFGFMG